MATTHPYRWTRARYYRAHHLWRLAMYHQGRMPHVCELLAGLLHAANKRDPLEEPISYRLSRRRGDDDSIPF